MSDVPADAPGACPGTTSEDAGKVSACQGCPNQRVCASGEATKPDPDLPAIESNLKDIKRIIIVLSGKGGVGKSSVTAGLTYFLAKTGLSIGVLDIDVCGPSLPNIFGVQNEQVHRSGSGWSPVFADEGICLMSVGFLLPSLDDAVIWRGPKKSGMIKQFLKEVDWSGVDVLVIDTPPGTSDEHLSIVKYIPGSIRTGAIVVTTPHEVSILDVRKEIDFCRRVKLPILGVVENMSMFICPKCKFQSQIFPPNTGGAEAMCKELELLVLAKIPLDNTVGQCCDEGINFIERFPDSEVTASFSNIINGIQDFLA